MTCFLTAFGNQLLISDHKVLSVAALRRSSMHFLVGRFNGRGIRAFFPSHSDDKEPAVRLAKRTWMKSGIDC